MLILFYLLLMLRDGRCIHNQNFETKIVGLGRNVKLECTREQWETLAWIRLVSGSLPEIIGRTFRSQSADPRIRTTEESGTFVLRIQNSKLKDTAVYFCLRILPTLTFVKGTHLRVEGPKPNITDVHLSDPVHPEDTENPQCLLLSDSENNTSTGERSVHCFRSGSHQPHPRYPEGNSVEECEKKHDVLSAKKYIHQFFKNISSSDAGNYYCAVATCEEIVCGNGSEPNIEINTWETPSLLCAALAISLAVIAFLIYSVKKLKKSCSCCNASGALQTHPVAATADHQSQQTDEDSLVYSVATFTGREAGKGGTRKAKTVEEESIYTDVNMY